MAFGGDLACQLDREAEGIIELEYFLAGDRIDVLVKRSADKVCKYRKSGIYCGIKALLLDGKKLFDVVCSLGKLRISSAAFADG